MYTILNLINYLCVLILIQFVQPYGLHNYDPYRKMIIEDDRLCSESTKRKIELNKNKYKALHVTLTTTKDHVYDWTSNKHCEFKTTADDDHFGLMVVIQKINLRMDSFGNCIDYIQFKSKNGDISERFCGHWTLTNEDDVISFRPKQLPYSFVSYQGKIETHIHVAKEKLLPGEQTDMNIVYTMFTGCDTHYKDSCIFGDAGYCIDKKYLLDGIVNCAFQGCADEVTCALRLPDDDSAGKDIVYDLGPKKVELGVMAVVIVIVFVTFCVGAYVLKKTGTLCWSSNFVTPPTRTRTQPTRTRQPQPDPIQTSTNTSVPPTAPPVDVPPTYESLFPNVK